MQKDWRKMLTELGGWGNELLSVPAGAVREIIEEVEALRESARLYATIIAAKEGEIGALWAEVTHLAEKLAERDAPVAGSVEFEDRPIKYRVLRNELAIIIGCADGHSGAEKADAVLGWIERQGKDVFAHAAPQPVDAAPKDAKATPDLQWRYQKYLEWCERSNYAALSWSDFVESRTNSGQRHHKPMTYGPAVDAAQANNYHEAYRGARDDMQDWKRRALEAEHKLAHALGEMNGPTFMGEPAIAVAAAQAAPEGEFKLTQSIIHKCPALVLPQTFLQKLGMTAQLVVLKGADDALAQALLAKLNAAAPSPAAQPAAQAVPDDDLTQQERDWINGKNDGEPLIYSAAPDTTKGA